MQPLTVLVCVGLTRPLLPAPLHWILCTGWDNEQSNPRGTISSLMSDLSGNPEEEWALPRWGRCSLWGWRSGAEMIKLKTQALCLTSLVLAAVRGTRTMQCIWDLPSEDFFCFHTLHPLRFLLEHWKPAIALRCWIRHLFFVWKPSWHTNQAKRQGRRLKVQSEREYWVCRI